MLAEACLSDVTDEDTDSPRSAVSILEPQLQPATGAPAGAAAARGPVVAHSIRFWEHISPARYAEPRAEASAARPSAPIAIVRPAERLGSERRRFPQHQVPQRNVSLLDSSSEQYAYLMAFASIEPVVGFFA
jgi:hypothetical protein